MKDYTEINKIHANVINKHKKRSSIFLSVGLGKTYLALKYACDNFKNKKVLFTGEKQIYLDNAKKELFNLTSDIIDINYVCLDSLKNEIKHYDLIIYDESHIGTGIFVNYLEQVLKINPNIEVLCLTGTPKYKNTDFKKLLNICPEIYNYVASDAIENKLINDIEIIPIYHDLSKEKNIYIKTDKLNFYTSEQNSYNSLYKKYENLIFKGGFPKELSYLKLFFKNLKSKEVILKTLLSKDKTLIYAGSIEQANRLKEELKCGIYHSKQSKEINKIIYDNFFNDTINILINVNGIKESANIKNLKTGVIMSVDAASHGFEQILGRFSRLIPEKEIGKIYVLIAKNTIEEEWFEKASINLKSKIIK